MNGRQRVAMALEHREPDRVPLDLGGSSVSGMHVWAVYRLRQALQLDPPGTPVKVIRPYLMLGEVAPDLAEALGIDVVRLAAPSTMFGYRAEEWIEWTTFHGTPVLVPREFNTEAEANGDLLQYPGGDKSLAPSGRMPAGGWYFDAIIRQDPIDDAQLDPADNLEEFGPISDADLAYLGREAARLYDGTGRALMGKFSGTGFGDIAAVPAPWLPHPRGIRDVAEWYMSTVTRREYVYEVFDRQAEIALANLERIYPVVGDRVSVAYLTGTDFGAQRGPFLSPQIYRELYQPFHRRLNDWIHAHTAWKTFMHTCGSIMPLIPDFVAAGFDILNPVQFTASGMDPAMVKRDFGDHFTFWGAGIDTQQVLPFGTPDEVRAQVREKIRIFAPGGGFVFSTVHNVQPQTPVENLVAMYETVREFGEYT